MLGAIGMEGPVVLRHLIGINFAARMTLTVSVSIQILQLLQLHQFQLHSQVLVHYLVSHLMSSVILKTTMLSAIGMVGPAVIQFLMTGISIARLMTKTVFA